MAPTSPSIRSNNTSPFRSGTAGALLLGSLIASLTPSAAQASSGSGIRGFFNLGPWMSRFTQSAGSHETKISSLPSLGIQAQLGASISLMFLEYSASWLISPYSASPKERDASYFTLMGLNAGVSLPLLPIELYGGIEKGNYKLNGGINPSYGGYAGKLGANFYFVGAGAGKGKVGLKGEFRRVFISADEAGSLPSGSSTQADTYFIGLTFGTD